MRPLTLIKGSCDGKLHSAIATYELGALIWFTKIKYLLPIFSPTLMSICDVRTPLAISRALIAVLNIIDDKDFL